MKKWTILLSLIASTSLIAAQDQAPAAQNPAPAEQAPAAAAQAPATQAPAAQAPAPQAPAPSGGCAKNVSFAVAENGQPVPDVPKFTLKWLEGKSRKEHFSNVCFSQIPSATRTNYIVVFSTSESAFEGLKPTAHTYTSAGQGGNAPIASYGGTWDYAYTGVTPPPTTDSLDLKRDDKPKQLDVRAFDQSGRSIAHYNLAKFGSRDKLLEQVISDIASDSPPPESRKSITSPMSIYYINCNVDNAGTSAAGDPGAAAAAAAMGAPKAAAPTPQAAPPPPPMLDVWSSPSGADIFVDGNFVGKTPASIAVPPGEHTVNLRKKDFGIWQRKILAGPGTRRIGAPLEQKVLNLQ